MQRILTIGLALVAVVLAGSAAPTGAAPAGNSRQADTDSNIVETAVAAGKFKTLTALVKKAGLAGTLQGKGPFTVFAPTDAAFAKVPKATLTALGKDKAKLRSVSFALHGGIHSIANAIEHAIQCATRSAVR